MLLPPVPAVLAVIVTWFPVELAVMPAVTGQALIAAARFAAAAVVSLLIAKVPLVELPHVFVPSVPAVTEPQDKTDASPPVVKLVSDPGVVALTVKAPLDAAFGTLTPMLLPFPLRLIASATFCASCVVVAGPEPDQYGKFAPEVEPLEPPVMLEPDQLKPPDILCASVLFPEDPVALAVIVTTLEDEVALTPVVPVLLLMAVLRLVAVFVGLVLSIAKVVPLVEPLVPPLI